MSRYLSAPADLVDLCLSQIEMQFLREALDRSASGVLPVPKARPLEPQLPEYLRRLPSSSRSVVDARRAACAIERLTAENRGLRELYSAWRGFALAAGGILLLVLWNVLSRSD